MRDFCISGRRGTRSRKSTSTWNSVEIPDRKEKSAGIATVGSRAFRRQTITSEWYQNDWQFFVAGPVLGVSAFPRSAAPSLSRRRRFPAKKLSANSSSGDDTGTASDTHAALCRIPVSRSPPYWPHLRRCVGRLSSVSSRNSRHYPFPNPAIFRRSWHSSAPPTGRRRHLYSRFSISSDGRNMGSAPKYRTLVLRLSRRISTSAIHLVDDFRRLSQLGADRN